MGGPSITYRNGMPNCLTPSILTPVGKKVSTVAIMRDEMTARIELLEKQNQELEARVRVVESEVNDDLDLEQYYVKGD